MIIVVDNNTLQILRILVTRPKLISPSRSAQIVGVVVGTMVYLAVGAVVDANVTARSRSTIIGMEIEIIV